LDAHLIDAGARICIYRWDNYISLLQHHHPDAVSQWLFATHRMGQEPSFAYTEVANDELVSRLRAMRAESRPFVLNLDLDFFRSTCGDRFPVEDRKRLFEEISALRANGNLLAITVCLSPECCGSWLAAEQLLEEFTAAVQVRFALPATA
jgi:hypothetical protein